MLSSRNTRKKDKISFLKETQDLMRERAGATASHTAAGAHSEESRPLAVRQPRGRKGIAESTRRGQGGLPGGRGS